MPFRQRCAPANNYTVLHSMPQAEAADPDKIRNYISADAEYMEKSFKQLVAGIEQRAGVSLDAARANSVEARRQNLKSRLEDLQTRYFNTMNEFHMERNRLVEQIHALKSYVEFQLQQQKDMQAERTSDSPIPTNIEGIERDASGRQIWIPLQANETLSFNYVTNNPRVSRLLGRITFEPNTISSRMPGTYTMQRATHNGKSYAVLMPDPSFSGTFTVMIGNKRSLVEVKTEAENQADRARGIQNTPPERPRGSDVPPGGTEPERRTLPERTYRPNATLDWNDSAEALVAYQLWQEANTNLQRSFNEALRLSELAVQNPLNETVRAQLQTERKNAEKFQSQTQEFSAASTRLLGLRTSPIDRKNLVSQFTGPEKERITGIYNFVTTRDKGIPMWVSTSEGVPTGKPGFEYMVASDGYLYGRQRSGTTISNLQYFDGTDWKAVA